ncbi:MAG: RpiB/LacA/LacB family sugar-phosphate isomerase [Mycoplasmatota bacterium]
MKIVIASDHAGYLKKQKLIKKLKNYNLIDLGTNSLDSVDYPIYAKKVCDEVNKGADFGILLCGTGIGMSIAANKIKNIRCAKVNSVLEAKLSRNHNNANVIALSSKMSMFKMVKIVKTFLEANEEIEQRHIKRIEMLDIND